MKTTHYALLMYLLTGLSLCASAALDSSDGDDSVKSRMIWEISGIYNDSAGRPFCVNDTLAIYVKNRNTRKPLGSAFVRIFYGLERVASLYTEYTGVVYFTPNRTGVHKVLIEKAKYQDLRGTFNVTDCTKASTTSTTETISTTTSTILAETTTTMLEPEATTTLEVATTAPTAQSVPETTEPAFSSCGSCAARKDQTAILYAVAIALTLVVLTYSLLSDRKKKKKTGDGAQPVNEPASKGAEEHRHKNQKKEAKKTKGETKK